MIIFSYFKICSKIIPLRLLLQKKSKLSFFANFIRCKRSGKRLQTDLAFLSIVILIIEESREKQMKLYTVILYRELRSAVVKVYKFYSWKVVGDILFDISSQVP